MIIQHDIAVVGGGPVGLTAALALAGAGRDVGLITPAETHFDKGRTAALMAPALELLGDLMPIGKLETVGATLAAIRIIDVTGALFRAPTLTFRAAEIGLDRFGLNIPNDRLVESLRQQVDATSGIKTVSAALLESEDQQGGLLLKLDNGQEISVRAAIAADGKRSAMRGLAGISTREWSYPQAALTFHVRHERDHLDTSTEFHTREGPFTLVPLSDGLSSVVWMMKPDRAQDLLAQKPAEFARAAQQTCQAILGRLTLASERALIPMSGLRASTMSKGRVALVGEAAHAFPPIGAQGLNLGIRDVRDLAKALDGGNDMDAAFRRYAAMRQADVMLRTAAVDALNRSLLAGFLPFDALRGLGMSALGSISPLRRAVMRLGIGNSASLFPFPVQAEGSPVYGNRSAGR